MVAISQTMSGLFSTMRTISTLTQKTVGSQKKGSNLKTAAEPNTLPTSRPESIGSRVPNAPNAPGTGFSPGINRSALSVPSSTRIGTYRVPRTGASGASQRLVNVGANIRKGPKGSAFASATGVQRLQELREGFFSGNTESSSSSSSSSNELLDDGGIGV